MKLLTLWLPTTCLALSLISAYMPIPWLYEEMGIVENLTVGFLLGGLGCLFASGFKNFKSLAILDKTLVVMLTLGCIYFAGEELSWGQHFLGFETTQELRKANYQQETNLHNLEGFTGDLLDKIPRGLLTVGILVGGVIFPFCKSRLPAWIARYVPPRSCVFPGALAVFISVPEKILKVTGVIKGHHGSLGGVKHYEARFDGGEMKEMYIALFILLFTVNFLRVLKTDKQAPPVNRLHQKDHPWL